MKPPFALRVVVFLYCHGECDLHPQEYPNIDKLLHLDGFQLFECGILDLVGIGHDSLELSLFAFLL